MGENTSKIYVTFQLELTNLCSTESPTHLQGLPSAEGGAAREGHARVGWFVCGWAPQMFLDSMVLEEGDGHSLSCRSWDTSGHMALKCWGIKCFQVFDVPWLSSNLDVTYRVLVSAQGIYIKLMYTHIILINTEHKGQKHKPIVMDRSLCSQYFWEWIDWGLFNYQETGLGLRGLGWRCTFWFLTWLWLGWGKQQGGRISVFSGYVPTLSCNYARVLFCISLLGHNDLPRFYSVLLRRYIILHYVSYLSGILNFFS